MKLTTVKHNLRSCFNLLFFRQRVCVCVCFKDTWTPNYKWSTFESLVCKLVVNIWNLE